MAAYLNYVRCKMKLTAIIARVDFGFSAHIKEIPEVTAEGDTIDDVLYYLQHALSRTEKFKGSYEYANAAIEIDKNDSMSIQLLKISTERCCSKSSLT